MRIRLSRTYKGLSQRELAELVGCSQAMIGRVETDGNTTAKMLAKICDAVDLDLVALPRTPTPTVGTAAPAD